MDNRLKIIAENYENMKIGVDESFHFHCKQCGKCCINREDILLNAKDLYRLAKYLGVTPEQFIKTYCEVYIGESSRIPIVRLKPQGSIKRCPLLKDRKCSVHQAKPVVCAMFPLGRCIRIEKDLQDVTDLTAGKIEYIFTRPNCGDSSETHTVREWLEEFGIPVEDEFFVQWHRTIASLSVSFHKMEEERPKEFMSVIWNVAINALYLHYDMTRGFEEQFAENAEILLDFIKFLPTLEEDDYNDGD